MHGFALLAFAGTALFALLTGPAHALNNRTWISGTGIDQAGCGPVATPCRTLQYAHDQTNAGGEIDVKDSAGYGSIIINKAISIVAEGTLAGVLAGTAGNAITINAGANDTVILRGLTVDGAKIGGNGILFNSGGDLTIANCVVKGFVKSSPLTGYGIWLKHSAGTPRITITGTTASYNEVIGIVYSPSGESGVYLSVSHSIVSHNGYGLSVYTGDAHGYSFVNISHTEAANNNESGFQFNQGSLSNTPVMLSYSNGNNNRGAGDIVVIGTALYISHVTAERINVQSGGGVYGDKTSYIKYDNFSGSNYTVTTPR